MRGCQRPDSRSAGHSVECLAYDVYVNVSQFTGTHRMSPHPTRDELEARLHYPLGQALPEPGHAIEVAPGIKWIRMVLPFALDHINLWLLRDRLDGREGWTVVDTCIA